MSMVSNELKVNGQKVTVEQLAYSRFMAFISYMFPDFEVEWFHKKICDKLEAVERGECQRLVLMAPPRHGKSIQVSEFFPAWYMGRNPDRQVIQAGYNDELAAGYGEKVREHIKEITYKSIFPGVEVSDSSGAKDHFELLHPGIARQQRKGVYKAAGVGSSTTGFGAHLFIIDDPVKNRTEADSPTTRQTIKDWYSSVVSTRLYKNSAVIIIMTRWHDDDLAGWVLKDLKHEGWDVLDIQAEDTSVELDADGDGRFLWEKRFGREFYKNAKKRNKRDWYAMYQQTPIIESGNIFSKSQMKMYPVQRGLPDFTYIVDSYDTAFSELKTADYSAKVTLGIFSPRKAFNNDAEPEHGIMLLDCWHRQIPFHTLKKDMAHDYQATYGSNRKRVDLILIEDKGSGQSMKQELYRANFRFQLARVKKNMAGVVRAHGITPIMDAGYFYIPSDWEDNPEMVEWMQEMMGFDKYAHDDFVDATVHGIKYLSDQGFAVTGTLVDDIEDEEEMYGLSGFNDVDYENPYLV